MVDGEIGEVEERVAHRGVLPVEYSYLVVVEEVFVEQIVVAKGDRPEGTGFADSFQDAQRPRKVERLSDALIEGDLVVVAHDLEGIEECGNRSGVVDSVKRRGDLAQHGLRRELLRQHWSTFKKAGHEVVPGRGLVEHFGGDADGGRQLIGRRFVIAVDAQQRGVVSGDAHDHFLVTEVSEEVGVGHAAGQSFHVHRSSRPQGLEQFFDRGCHRPMLSLDPKVATGSYPYGL